MKLALQWCAKEWRSQRALLAAYVAMACGSLGMLFFVAPEHSWRAVGRTSAVPGWFAALGVLGVLLFAAPQVVRGEFAGRRDQFVQRLPGALWPAFVGKLLFLLLATLLLPLLGLLGGELCLLALGRDWNDLFGGDHGDVVLVWPDIYPVLLAAMLLTPWVAAAAWCLPGGRMAAGAVAVLGAGLAFAGHVTLRASPGLMESLHWQPWLAYVAPCGLASAAVAFVCGRRGGGTLRSAKLGGAMLAAGLVPPAAFVGVVSYGYHHPDLRHPARFTVEALAPDLGSALLRVSGASNWLGVVARMDLGTGSAQQVAGVGVAVTSGIGYQPDYALQFRHRALVGDGTVDWIDLATGVRQRGAFAADGVHVAPPSIAAAVAAEARAMTPLRAPGGVRAWREARELVVAAAAGSTQRVPLSASTWVIPMGHGVRLIGAHQDPYFDLARGAFATLPKDAMWPFAIAGRWLLGNARHRQLFDPADGSVRELPELDGTGLLGVLDDACVLFGRGGRAPLELCTFDAVHGIVEPLAVPEAFAGRRDLRPLIQRTSFEPGQPLWLAVDGANGHVGFLAIDRATHRCTVEFAGVGAGGDATLLAATAQFGLLVVDQQIVRIDRATGARTVLYPRD